MVSGLEKPNLDSVLHFLESFSLMFISSIFMPSWIEFLSLLKSDDLWLERILGLDGFLNVISRLGVVCVNYLKIFFIN